MKALILILAFSIGSQAQSVFCALKTKADGHTVAPSLIQTRLVSDGILTQYLEQFYSSTTILGFNTDRLDSRNPYVLNFRAQLGPKTQTFKIQFTKSFGLVVKATDEVTGFAVKYEFLEAKSNPTTLSIAHKNGWNSEISCMPN